MNTAHDESFHAVLEAKYARIINNISEMYNVSLGEAMDIFYTSPFLPLLEEGVADLHAAATRIWQRRFGEKGRKDK